MAGLLVGAIADLEARNKSRLVSRLINLSFPIVFPTITRGASLSRDLGKSNPAAPVQIRSVFFHHHRIMAKRTEGIARVPLKRRRTRLSIPLGLRHAESTRIKRSLWWRMKPLEPVHQYFVNILVPLVFASLFRRLVSGNGGDGVVGPRARASKGISIFRVGWSRGIEEKRTLLDDRDVLLGGNHLEYAVRIASLLRIRLNEGAYLDCLLSSDGGLFRRAASRRDLGKKIEKV